MDKERRGEALAENTGAEHRGEVLAENTGKESRVEALTGDTGRKHSRDFGCAMVQEIVR